jgi:DNA-binding MarR family transcriptional regulator
MTMRKADTSVAGSRSRCSCTALRKATRRISQLYDAALAPSGLKITQRAILAQIGRAGSTNVGMLAEALVMDAGALAHTLRPLERDGFVSIDVNPDDRRHRLISLTSAGQAKLAETDALWSKAQAGFDAAFGRANSAALREAMDVLLSEEFVGCFEQYIAKHPET